MFATLLLSALVSVAMPSGIEPTTLTGKVLSFAPAPNHLSLPGPCEQDASVTAGWLYVLTGDDTGFTVYVSRTDSPPSVLCAALALERGDSVRLVVKPQPYGGELQPAVVLVVLSMDMHR